VKLDTVMRVFLLLCGTLCICLWWTCWNCDVSFYIQL